MTALPQENRTARVPAKRSYSHRRAEKRARQRQRLAKWTPTGRTPQSLCEDPLIRRRRAWTRKVGLTGTLIVASVLMHGAAVFGFALFGGILERARGSTPSHDERLEVAVIENEPPKPEEPLDTKTDRAVTRKPPVERPQKTTEPPPDPIQESPPPRPQRRRIVGLSFESTVVGGGGPAFAVGNTRMGETDRVASDPSLAQKPPPANRVAVRIPTAAAKFDPPEKIRRIVPDYPPELKALGMEADVVLRVTVAADGTVREVTIVKGATQPGFNDSAVRAAQRETYRPARRDGVAIEHTIKFTVRFRLTDY